MFSVSHSGTQAHHVVPREATTLAPATETQAVATPVLPDAPSYRLVSSELPRELPNEIWGIVADFSARDTILNLRAVTTMLREEAERAIVDLSLTGQEQIDGFANATGFAHVQNLSISHCKPNDLLHLAAALERKPHCRPNLRVSLALGHGPMAAGLSALRTVGLASLSVRYGETTVADALALTDADFPIHLRSGFTKESLIAAAGIRTLTVLRPLYGDFDDEVARAFGSHPALQVLVVTTDSHLTEVGLQTLAGMSVIGELVLNGHVLTMGTDTARALACSNTLMSLSMYKTTRFRDEAAIAALSQSRSLQTLWITAHEGLHHLGDMRNLSALHLIGDIEPGNILRRLTLRDVQALVQNTQLTALGLHALEVDEQVLPHIAREHRLEKLTLTSVKIDTPVVEALCANPRKLVLKLVDVAVDAAQSGALMSHRTLDVSHVESVFNERFALAAGQAWVRAGRPEAQFYTYLKHLGWGIMLGDDPLEEQGAHC